MALTLRERKEAEARRIEAAEAALARARRLERTWERLVTDAVCGRVSPADRAEMPLLDAIIREREVCRSAFARDAFGRLVGHAVRHAPRLLEPVDGRGDFRYLTALQVLAELSNRWERPLAAWSPGSRNVERQFAQLARHLLARYRVPAFMDSVLLAPHTLVHPAWFHHVGSGQNLRTAPGLTARLTKRQAHCALLAPESCRTLIQAIRWGQVRGLGGELRLARAVTATWLGRQLLTPEAEAWWATVFQWLSQHPMLDPVHVGPIIDYVHFRWLRDRGFRMAGRSPLALLALVDEWHRTLSRTKPDGPSRLPACGFAPSGWDYVEGARTWTITEIPDYLSLVVEGNAMRHCVATYAHSIMAGQCSIWSMKIEEGGYRSRAVTIELENATRTVVQVRGKCNRYPDEEELAVLQVWASENGLGVEIESG
jgi:hypothetical protein